MWNIHGDPTYGSVDLNPATVGDNTIVAANASGETFIQAFSVVVDGATTVILKKGSTAIGTFKLQAFQTLNLSDLPGMEGEPYYKMAKNEAFVLNSSAAVRITGTVTYATKN